MPVQYRELLDSVCRMTGLDSGAARAAAEATITALGRSLGEPERGRLLSEVPNELTNDFPIDGEPQDYDEAGFVRAVSLLGRRPPEQARLRAQAVLSALVEQEPKLVEELRVPPGIRPLFEPPSAGGGLTGPVGGAAPLTEEEVRAGLEGLPDWTGDCHGIRRTLTLPEDQLDRVLERVERIKTGPARRAPMITRHPGGVAELELCTSSVNAVTVLDLDLADTVDSVIADAAGGIGSPYGS
ncbi:DUF2267 domain-containing protein [Bailinhaonella thermotolerans]|uniref:Putative pterin-4-alpha-carbinolamine dehydratase n=1 Tax=Bailinhaonella thermotolerans TaxID=1070861 RepID=A0A3A4AWW4_9ACTN|nr:DUF2267 domain-containing protein [Bailinhaonella thermotolerans]RJL30323.1 DUF2267 domain-containing protein [Bailinhaonella thermotolerans]